MDELQDAEEHQRIMKSKTESNQAEKGNQEATGFKATKSKECYKERVANSS